MKTKSPQGLTSQVLIKKTLAIDVHPVDQWPWRLVLKPATGHDQRDISWFFKLGRKTIIPLALYHETQEAWEAARHFQNTFRRTKINIIGDGQTWCL